jgi:exopolyphosphatase/pppGpp-phosphohydrolase
MIAPRVTALLLVTAATVGCGRANDPAPPICAIDMGSNSFRRIVGTFDGGRYTEHNVEIRTLGVGDDLTRFGRISDAKLAEIEQVLARFQRTCESDGVAQVLAIGTAAFRDAPNGSAVMALARTLGIRFEIASEQRESELAYLVGSLGESDYAVVDNGSRSIELVADEGDDLRHAVLTLGYRVAYERFFATAEHPAEAIAAFRRVLDTDSGPATFMKGKRKLVGVEFREMAEVLFPPAEVEGRVFTVEQLRSRIDEIVAAGAAGFSVLRQTENIDRALPRLIVAEHVTRTFGYPQIELTTRELGTGLIIEAALDRGR